MSLYIFYITFFIFTILEVYIAIQFARRKKTILLKNTIFIYLLFLCLFIAEYLFKFRVANYIITFVIITLGCHSFVGDYLNIYNKSKHFDRYLHIFGAFSFSLFSYSIIDKTINHPVIPKLYASIFIVTLGITIGVFLEIIEFTQDSRMKTRNQKGQTDTNFDLIANVIGACIAGIYYYIVSI